MTPIPTSLDIGFTSGLDHQGLVYCPFLAAMVQEHAKLRRAMAEVQDAAQMLATIAANEAATAVRIKLECKLDTLRRLWEQHAGKEERQLFPVLANYFGADRSPCADYEADHLAAAQLLAHAGEAAARSGIVAAAEQRAARKQAAHAALEATACMEANLARQERMLFPMAQTMLTERDAALLSARL